MGLQIFWDPSGFELDRLGRKRLTRITDGDTPFIELSIRMLSIDPRKSTILATPTRPATTRPWRSWPTGSRPARPPLRMRWPPI